MSYAYTDPKGKREVFAGWDFIDDVRAKSGKGPDPHPFGLNRKYTLNPNRYSGETPPELSKQEKQDGYVWANVGTRGYQTNDPSSGSTNHTAAIWQKIQTGSAAKKDEKPGADTPPPPETPFTPSADTIAARDRVQNYLDQNGGSATGSTARSGLDLTATGPSLYQNLFDYGQSENDRFGGFLGHLKDRAMLGTLEIGDATGNALANYHGKVPDLMGSKEIKDLFKYYSGKIKDA